MKELHPDLGKNEDDFKKHLLFVETCNAYNRLLGEYQKAKNLTNVKGKGLNNKDSIVVHSDPAYVFYKNGIKYFSKIHPSQWNIDSSRMLNTRIAGKDEDQKIIKKKILDLVKMFPKAYYYFSIVVHEYPDSDWSYDAKEKMGIIENRTLMYKKIIESFSSWNIDKKEQIQEYNEKFNAHKMTRDNMSDADIEKWKK